MATYANSLNGNPIYADRAENDKNGDRIDTTYLKVANIPVTDVEVDGSSVVNAQGVAEITLPSSTQVQSDWTESDNTEPSFIQHKPTVKNLIAGTGISITETAQGIVISLA